MGPTTVKRSGVAFGIMVGMLALSAKYSLGSNDDNTPTSWIWTYVERPQQVGDGAESYMKLLALGKDCGKAKMDQEFIGELLRFGRFKTSGLRLAPEKVWPLREPLYELMVGNRRINADELTSLQHCIGGVVKREIGKGDRQALDRLARGLLLFGYQVSRNGEDVRMAFTRLVDWDQAIEVLMKTHPKDEPKLKRIREKLRQEMKDSNWNGELRHPF
jgi:hypothetical protein